MKYSTQRNEHGDLYFLLNGGWVGGALNTLVWCPCISRYSCTVIFYLQVVVGREFRINFHTVSPGRAPQKRSFCGILMVSLPLWSPQTVAFAHYEGGGGVRSSVCLAGLWLVDRSSSPLWSLPDPFSLDCLSRRESHSFPYYESLLQQCFRSTAGQ